MDHRTALALSKQKLERIVNWGSNPAHPPDDRRALRATNVACLYLLALTSPYVLLFGAYGAWLLAVLALAMCLSYLLVLGLMQRGMTRLARSLLIASINGNIFVFCMMLGPESRLETALFFGLTTVFLFFSAQRPRWLIGLGALPVAAYTALRLGAYDWVGPHPLSADEMRVFSEAIIPTTALLILIPLYLLLRTQVAAERQLVVDVAARAQAEEEVRRLSFMTVTAQEAERRALGLALHDGATQTLVAASLWASELARDTDTSRRERFRLLQGLIDDAFNDLRRLSHDLRPPVLDERGIVAALRELAHQFSTPTCTVSVHLPDEAHLPTDLAVALFRIVQTALGNAARHARAARVEVTLVVEPATVRLMIDDDGVGFDPTHHGHGLGLIGMRERTTWLGGHFHVDAAPGRGTRIRVAVPRQHAAPDLEP